MQVEETRPGGSFVLVGSDLHDGARSGSSMGSYDSHKQHPSQRSAGPAQRMADAARHALDGAVYTDTTCARITQRRAELQGVLFFDALLGMVSQGYESRAYPPITSDDVLHLVDLIAACQHTDRIKRAALHYYLCLDLDEQHASEHGSRGTRASHFARQSGIPSQMRQIISGYWHLDHGQYVVAASLLTEPDPALITKILQLLSPMPFTSSSASEVSKRSQALSQFLQNARLHERIVMDISNEEQIVLICNRDGIFPAWQYIRALGDEKDMDACVGRMIEHCFMPAPRLAAVKDLIASPLSHAEEEALIHNAVNPPPNISLSLQAHTMAVDIVLVRLINSGKHLEAVSLDRRIKASMSISDWTMQAHDEKEREALQVLRERRETMMRGALSVLSKMDRSFLDIGAGEKPASQDSSSSDLADADRSWEQLPIPEDEPGQHFSNAPPRKDDSRSIAASPAVRTPVIRPVDNVLSAIASVSPLRRSSAGQSPLMRSRRATPNIAQSGGGITASESISLGSPGQNASFAQQMGTSESATQQQTPSRLGKTSRPYHLASTLGEDIEQDVSTEALVDDGMAADASMSAVGDETQGPYSELAQKLDREIQRDGTSIDAILKRSFNSSPFLSGPRDKNAHATLTLKKPVRRYQAKYEIGEPSSPHRADRLASTSSPVAQTAQKRRTGRHTGGRISTTQYSQSPLRGPELADKDEDDDGNTSIPGSFPDQDVESEDHKAGRSHRRDVSRRAASRRVEQDVQDEVQDAVPEMVQTPAMTRSKSGNVRRTPRTAVTLSSTPLRRSARLSVEPEEGMGTNGPASPEMPVRRSERGTPSRRSSTRHRSASPTKPEKQARTGSATTAARRTRGTSQALTDDGIGDDDDVESQSGAPSVLTRSRSRRGSSLMPGGL